MKVTNVKDFKNRATTYLKADEPVLVVRHGKVAGLLLPLQNKNDLPLELWQDITGKLADYSGRRGQSKDVPEDKIT